MSTETKKCITCDHLQYNQSKGSKKKTYKCSTFNRKLLNVHGVVKCTAHEPALQQEKSVERTPVELVPEIKEEYITLTLQLLQAGGTKGVGYTKAQVKLLGATYQKGWRHKLIGKKVLKSTYNLFLDLQGIPNRKAINKVEEHFHRIGRKVAKIITKPKAHGNYIVLTNKDIEAGFSDAGGVTDVQLSLLGVERVKGWKKSLVGRLIHKDTLEFYQFLKGIPKEEATILLEKS